MELGPSVADPWPSLPELPKCCQDAALFLWSWIRRKNLMETVPNGSRASLEKTAKRHKLQQLCGLFISLYPISWWTDLTYTLHSKASNRCVCVCLCATVNASLATLEHKRDYQREREGERERERGRHKSDMCISMCLLIHLFIQWLIDFLLIYEWN